MDNNERQIKMRGTERPCRYILGSLLGERRGIIIGIGPAHYLIRDSRTLETHTILKSNVKEVALWGPEDIPKDYFRKQGIRV